MFSLLQKLVILIKFGLKYFIPVFLISFTVLSLAYYQTSYNNSNMTPYLTTTEYKNYYPSDIQASAEVSNGTHLLLFGGTNDSWDGLNTVRAISLQQLYEINTTNNPSALYQTIGSLPYLAYNLGVVTYSNLIYLFGGFDNGTDITTILKVNTGVYPYNYSIVAHLPIGLEQPNVIRVNNIVYIFGGRSIQHESMEREIYSFNITDNTIQDLHLQTPTISPKLCYYNKLIYLIGGTDPNIPKYSSSEYSFNPVTNQIVLVSNSLKGLYYSNSMQFNNKIFLLTQREDSQIIKQPVLFDFTKISYEPVNSNFPFPTNNVTFENNFNLYTMNNNDLYLFGGIINSGISYSHSVYVLNFKSLFGVQAIKNQINNQHYVTTNNNSNYLVNNDSIKFNYDTTKSILSYFINPVKLQDSDTIQVDMNYIRHNDVDSRQLIENGFTNAVPSGPVNQMNSIPATNFIGLQLRNNQAGGVNYLYATALVVNAQNILLSKNFLLVPNIEHTINFELTVINDSYFYYCLHIDGNVLGEVIPGNLINMQLKEFASWNTNMFVGASLEGNYSGILTNFNIFHKPAIQNTKLVHDLLLVCLFLNFFVIVVLIYIVRSPRFKYLSTGSKPEGIPTSVIDLGFYNLYLQLKKLFTKIEMFSVVNLEDDSSRLDDFQGKFNFIKEDDSYPNAFDPELLDDISGVAIKILINLLEYLDHGTYLTHIQINLGINRSKFYYTINKLNEKGFIILSSTITDDQRKKYVTISSKGYSLLKLIYQQLDDYFNQKK